MLFLVLVLTACSSDDSTQAPACVQNLSTQCAALYDPQTYQTIYDKILHPTCATGNGTCHTSDGAKGGLVFENVDTAYALLLGTSGGKVRVVPGNPACSLIVEKLESGDPTYRMPPGSEPLLAGERCTIEKWIAQGAKR